MSLFKHSLLINVTTLSKMVNWMIKVYVQIAIHDIWEFIPSFGQLKIDSTLK